jgi:glycine betaine/proline transport system permease protein
VAVAPITLPRPLAGRLTRTQLAAVLAALMVGLYLVFRDQWLLPHDDRAPIFRALNDVREWVDDNRASNPLLVALSSVSRSLVGGLANLFRTALGELSWLGVTVIATMIGLVWCGSRVALLVLVGFLSFGLLGLWPESMDTLALTLAAVVLSLAIGVPLGVLAGRSDRFLAAIQPLLDAMQIMPTIAYLAPLTLLFLIGPPTAVIATMIYAVPTTIRITALGIRRVPPESVEAAVSLGSTHWQTLWKVQLPMARRTIVLAINQTLMMALAMVVITALIAGPGLGQSIVRGLQRLNVGQAFEAGLAIVILAVVLDRLTSAASTRAETAHRAGRAQSDSRRRWLIAGAAVGCLVAVVAGMILPFGAEFPDALRVRLADPVNAITDWVQQNLYHVTIAVKDAITYSLINPLQTLLVTAPWWLVVVGAMGVALLVSRARTAVLAGACLVAVALLGLWEHGMITLATTFVAVTLTLAVGVLLGIWSARSDRVARALRPVLDAAQTMPSFVYLVPVLALFGPTRFTAIVAALIYAAPSVIRLVEDGIRGVPAGVLEAARSTGATPRQLLWKVQLPMARPAILLAANQGIILVLAMVVVGGLVGAGALGFDVVVGFSKSAEFGKGLAAGIAIVLLGIMLDRITQAAGSRPARASEQKAA